MFLLHMHGMYLV